MDASRSDGRSDRPQPLDRGVRRGISSPLFIGRQVPPPSSLRKAPAAEMATKMRSGLLGSSRMVCRHIPPAPGCQRLPFAARRPGSSCQVLRAVGGAEKGRVFHPGVNRVGIGQRRFEMPDAFEFPRVLSAIIELMRARRPVVDEILPHRLPRFATVVGALNPLPKPAGGLRRVDPVRINRRTFEMIKFPARKVRAADFPVRALAVRGEDKGAFACANQKSYCAHVFY